MTEYFTKDENGKFILTEHPDTARVKEFRETNVALMQVAAKWEGIDPDAAKAALAKVAAGDAPDVVKLKLDLATEKGRSAAAIADAAALTHRHAVSAAFLAHGGRPEAVDFIVSKAPADADELTEWLADAAVSKELAFAFQPSSGGGAAPKTSSTLGARSNVNVLRNPTPQQLGEHAADIRAGKTKIEITT